MKPGTFYQKTFARFIIYHTAMSDLISGGMIFACSF
jgi:hypothetical protein